MQFTKTTCRIIEINLIRHIENELLKNCDILFESLRAMLDFLPSRTQSCQLGLATAAVMPFSAITALSFGWVARVAEPYIGRRRFVEIDI